MPIYAYRCTSCRFENDVMQKMSDAPLTTCPECKAETFSKQLSAAGFQLKGSGLFHGFLKIDFSAQSLIIKTESLWIILSSFIN